MFYYVHWYLNIYLVYILMEKTHLNTFLVTINEVLGGGGGWSGLNCLGCQHVYRRYLVGTREIHPLEPQRHRHSMLAPRVCAPRVTQCGLGHVI